MVEGRKRGKHTHTHGPMDDFRIKETGCLLQTLNEVFNGAPKRINGCDRVRSIKSTDNSNWFNGSEIESVTE